MKLKLLLVMVEPSRSMDVMDCARRGGVTGATLIHQTRGEGRRGLRDFMGLSLDAGRDLLLFLVPENRTDSIMEAIADAGSFDESPGTGIVFQVDVEDSVGLDRQLGKQGHHDRGQEERS